MKKILITFLTAILVVMMFTACGASETKEEPEQDPVQVEDPEKGAEEESGPETKTAETGTPDSVFVVGEEYVLKEDMKVREGASVDSRWKKTSELSEEDKDKAESGEKAVLKEGYTVKCLETDKDWIRISSGWICGYEKGRYYIRSTEADNYWNEQNARFHEKIGMGANDNVISGIYTVKGDDVLDSIEFFTDGECAVHHKTPAFPVTDEEGYTNGMYHLSGDKVYINSGGSVYVDVYKFSGNNTLQPLPDERIG